MKKEMLLDSTSADNLSCTKTLRDILISNVYSEEQVIKEFEIAKKDIWLNILLAYYKGDHLVEKWYTFTPIVANRLMKYFAGLGITVEAIYAGIDATPNLYDKAEHLFKCPLYDFSDYVKALPEYKEALQEIWKYSCVWSRYDKNYFTCDAWYNIAYYEMNNQNSFITILPKDYSEQGIELLKAYFKGYGIKIETYCANDRVKIAFSWDCIDSKKEKVEWYSYAKSQFERMRWQITNDVCQYVVLCNAFSLEPKTLYEKYNYPIQAANLIEKRFLDLGIDVKHYITKSGKVVLKIKYMPEFDLSKLLSGKNKEIYLKALDRKVKIWKSILKGKKYYEEDITDKSAKTSNPIEKIVYNRYLSRYGVKITHIVQVKDSDAGYDEYGVWSKAKYYMRYHFLYEKDKDEIREHFDINEVFPELVGNKQYEFVYKECKEALLNGVHKSRGFEHCLSNESKKYILENDSIMRKLSIEFYLEGINAVLYLIDQPKILFNW